jgi:hypothetical protein
VSTKSRSGDADILVVVHPYQTAAGPADVITEQWALIEDWSGPVIVLMDKGGNPNASIQGTTYLDVVFDRTASQEDAGMTCRIDADADSGRMIRAIDQLLEMVPESASFLVTGASLDGCCAEVADLLFENDRIATIDDTAISRRDMERAQMFPPIDDSLISSIFATMDAG